MTWKNAGKRKTNSHRICQKGEHIFPEWAQDRHLTANKVSEDYGVDFFCEILQPLPGSDSEEPTGSVLGVQVRAVRGGSRPRVTLDRTDAQNFLRQTYPACLVGVHVTTRQVHFRFLDEPFSDELRQFLRSRSKTMSLLLKTMLNDPQEFDRRISRLRRPVAQYTQRVQAVERTIRDVAPGAKLRIESNSAGSLALISVPWVGSVYRIERDHDGARTAIFDRGQYPHNVPGVLMKPELREVEDIAHTAMIEGTAEGETVISVKAGTESATLTFRVRCLDDEFAFSHDVGLTLVVSGSRLKGGHWVHEIESRLFEAAPLASHPAAKKFLTLLRPGAQMSLGGRSWLNVETWGRLMHIGTAVSGLGRACDTGALHLPGFALSDLRDEELGRSLSFLDGFLSGELRLEHVFGGFLLNDALYGTDGLRTEEANLEIPIALNVKDYGLLVTATASGTVYLSAKQACCGFRVDQQKHWTIQTKPRFTKSIYPEIWIDESIPALKIGHDEPGDRKFEGIPNPNILATTRIHFRTQGIGAGPQTANSAEI